MEIMKEEEINTFYIFEKLNKDLFQGEGNLVRVISAFDEIGLGVGYEVKLYVVKDEQLKELLEIIPNRKKKNIVSFNLLPFCTEVTNPETEEVVYLPTGLMKVLSTKIEDESSVIFKDSLKTTELRYKSMEEIPFVKNNVILNKYKIVKIDDFEGTIKANLSSKDRKIKTEVKDFCFKLYEEIEELKEQEKDKVLESLRCMKSKINSHMLFSEKEIELFNSMYERFLLSIKKGEESSLYPYNITKKRLNKREK